MAKRRRSTKLTKLGVPSLKQRRVYAKGAAVMKQLEQTLSRELEARRKRGDAAPFKAGALDCLAKSRKILENLATQHDLN
jgi:hypothetical protein